MALKKSLLLLFCVQISDSFQITNCSDYKLVKNDNKTIEIGCTSSDWYGYCTLANLNTHHTCNFSIYNNLIHGYRGHAEKNCQYFPQKVQFKGLPDKFICKFELVNENIKDNDSWTITMQDWYNINVKVTSEKFAFEAPKTETGCLDKDAKFVGSDLVRSEIKAGDVVKNIWKDCQILCSQTENCSFWSWESNRSCFLKNNDAIKKLVYSNTTISGSKDCENCHKLEATLNETKARSLGLSSCGDITYQAEMLHFERTGSAVGAFVGSMVFAAAFFGSIFIYYYIVVVRMPIRRNRAYHFRTSIITSTKNELMAKDTKKPIPTANFIEAVRNGLLPTQHEFTKLSEADGKYNVLQLSDTQGRYYTSKKHGGMNRYGNIIPYDHNRVILHHKVNNCDYVNASWITDSTFLEGMPSFIAAQGPFEHTIPHFLEMVVENKTHIIIMLTQLTEDNENGISEKCAQYWPSEIGGVSTFGHIEVRTLKETIQDEMETTIRREFEIRDTVRNVTFGPVVHFYFPTWPDFGVADSSNAIIDLIMTTQDMIHDTDGSPSTVLVHCSAGVGRTGTFIALYRLMAMFDSGALDETIDIYNQVFQLRADRCLMVQKEPQYKFLYEALASFIQMRTEDQSQEYTYHVPE